MTRNQTAVLLAIAKGRRTYRSIMKETGLCRVGVWDIVEQLVDDGLIKKQPGLSGALSVPMEGARWAAVNGELVRAKVFGNKPSTKPVRCD